MFLHDCSTAMMFYLVLFQYPKQYILLRFFFFFFFFFFFTIALPSGFYYEKTELLSQEVFSAMLCIFFKSACIKSASRHSVIHVFFLLRYHRITVGAPGCEA